MLADWIWLKNWQAEDKEKPILVLFRKTLFIRNSLKVANIKISADSRYKLYINSKLIEVGPSKGDKQVWFFDIIDISKYLKKGENVFAVEVLRYPLEHLKGNHSIYRTEYPGLYIEGKIIDIYDNLYDINTNKSWKAIKNKNFEIISEDNIFAPLQIYERCIGNITMHNWKKATYNDEKWEETVAINISEAISPANLHARTIPYLYRKTKLFSSIVCIRNSIYDKQMWQTFLNGVKALEIPPHSKEIVEISANEEMTGYLRLIVEQGRNSCIKILQSEAYVQNEMVGNLPLKLKRDDYINGHLEGFSDIYIVGGFGNKKSSEIYEPFWFRTFRYIRLEIQTFENPLILKNFYYIETGYPLEVKTKIEIPSKEINEIWNISERTLRRCMHETYEDCPFYEQLQYSMDARSQILYTYAISADDRLARKCIDDFKRSQRYDGLLNCSAPCYGVNVIPGFSIYYILMLFDHMMYFGDKRLLEYHLPTIENILNYFDRNLSPEGYVKKIGGLNGKDRYWSFIDWTKEWDKTTGVPTATLKGAITMESLLYIMGLQYTEKIALYLENISLATKCKYRYQKVQKSILKYCLGKNGMIQDGPNIETYSQHTQVFAILTDTVDIIQGRKILEETIIHAEKYAQCSVAMAFYLFRALEKTNLYLYTKKYWQIWQRMIEKNVTTCIEDEIGERSDCHAWGALILYELPSVILGVRPIRAGYRAVSINPKMNILPRMKGKIITPKGYIEIDWSEENKEFFKYRVPDNMEVILK